MFGMDTKSLIIGAAVGYFLLPRVTGFVTGKLAGSKPAQA